MLLAHPEAEDLGRFVEGTLEDPERAAIVDHLADCDDCRMLVVDAAEFESQSAVEPQKWGIARWLAIAAAVVFVVALGSFSNHEYRENAAGRRIDLVDDAAQFITDCIDTSIRDGQWLLKHLAPGSAATDPLAKVEEDYGKLKARPLEARLSGFPYVPRHTMRSGNDEDADVPTLILQGEAAGVSELRGDDPQTLHARGIGHLLTGSVAESIAPLQSAADREPGNAKYQSDLAAALIAASRGDRAMLQSALAACDRALRIDSRSPDALFNRAVALDALQRPEALQAYERYLAVDASSPWAAEARQHIELLRPLP
ncbi:MAG: hypothetical protein QOF63_2586 [Thermoanaerobaculia bacterium]|jgi:hypothetical protein|nr:hypothetical protein [Thermoanaerobaculia bacterium]